MQYMIKEMVQMKKSVEWDMAKHLDSEEMVTEYLNAALEDGDPAVISAALGDIARARGMTQLSRETGISRDGLYKALSATGNPSFIMVQSVIEALGLKLVAQPA